MTAVTLPRATVEQALEALRCVDLQSLVPDYGSGHYSVPRSDGPQLKSAISNLERALAQQAEPVAADALTEPKSGDKWRVEWWNESCRMMLPAHAKLDSFVAYKNGTIQFTIKRTPA